MDQKFVYATLTKYGHVRSIISGIIIKHAWSFSMGQIIQMPSIGKKIQTKITNDKNLKRTEKSRKNQLKNSDYTGAEILFFTGVRYERLEEGVSVPVNLN